MKPFFDWVTERKSLLCVGLDPTPEQLDFHILRRIIEATADLVGAFKPNIAFFEVGGPGGIEVLRQCINLVHELDVPVIVDAKREDIGHTAGAYAKAVFGVLNADAITAGPYLGRDSVGVFADYPDKGVYVLCHTSNSSAEELQHQRVGGRPLYLHVAELASEVWNKNSNIGLVVGATFPEAIAKVREVAPRLPFLIPGVGPQGGDLEKSVRAGIVRDTGGGVLINVSRGVANAPDYRAAAQKFRDDLEKARAAAMSQLVAGEPNDSLVLALFEAECVRFGDFTLHSGAHSPIYIDLRTLVSKPDLMWVVARAYAKLLAGLSFSRLAAIPYAGLPIGGAVSLLGNWPLIYPREPKGHGTKVSIEGAYVAEEKVVVLDDLVTTGASKLEAIAPLLEAGLRVTDIVVLIDREQGGREQLIQAGYCLYSLLTLRQIVTALARLGKITAQDMQKVLDYLGQ